MSNVYKRNRTISQFKMYLISKEIKHELFEMSKVKDQKYFPNDHKITYYSLLKDCDELTKYITSIYTLKLNLYENYKETKETIDKAINLSETCIQIIQNRYKDMNLNKAKTNNLKLIK